MVQAKRMAPADVKPVIKGKIEYSVPHFTTSTEGILLITNENDETFKVPLKQR